MFGLRTKMGGEQKFIQLALAIVIGFTIMVALIPTALTGWYNVTAAGGEGVAWSTSMKALWNMVPLMVVIGILVAVIALAYPAAKAKLGKG